MSIWTQIETPFVQTLFNMNVEWWTSRGPQYAPALETNLYMPWWGLVEKGGSCMALLDEDSHNEQRILDRLRQGDVVLMTDVLARIVVQLMHDLRRIPVVVP